MQRSKGQKITIKSLSVSLTGIFIVCIGLAFNNNSLLGNDPVGIFYDGIRVSFHLSRLELGYISNYINIGLVLILLLLGRKYVNIGTFLYLIPYGTFLSIGSHLYPLLFANHHLITRVLAGILGCSLYYIGISLFVASEIGLDPFNGFMMTIRDLTGWSIRKAKIVMDIGLTVLGFFLGGTFGLITLVTALTTGPAIQYLSEKFKQRLYNY